MSFLVLASVTSLVTSPAELLVLIATIVLLSIRSYISVMGVGLTRRGALVLTNLTLLLAIVFFVLVIVRFKTLGG
jgi:hypothetical protein